MPPRSKILTLPDVVRVELDRRLSENGFADYVALAEWLTEAGFPIGKSAVHRYGAALEEKLAAVTASAEAARQIAAAAPDDADLRSAAVMSLVQTEVFNVLIALQRAGEEDDPSERLKTLTSAGKAIAELSRASANQKRRQDEVEARVKAAAEAVERVADGGGLASEALARIRQEIYGIAQ